MRKAYCPPPWHFVACEGYMDQHLHNVQQEMRELLKSNNLRCTTSRLAVLVTMHEHKAPLTHQEIMKKLSPGSFDKASIWRILADLAERGLLRRMDLGDRIWRYELLDTCRSLSDEHAHFLCDACGIVYCLPPVELRSQSNFPEALKGADFHIRITGRCTECVNENSKAE